MSTTLTSAPSESAVRDSRAESPNATTAVPDSIPVWGVPFSPVTFKQSLEIVNQMVESRVPGHFITANLDTVMKAEGNEQLRDAMSDATFVVADGMPIVWWSKLRGCPLPERVAGSDLIFGISEQAAKHGHRVFLLGGAPEVGQTAAENLRQRFPGINIVGIESPPYRELTPIEDAEMMQRIRDAKPDIMFVAFGQPRGEIWIKERVRQLNIPVAVQLGASIDFVAGRVSRSPKWIAAIGMEWMYRFYLEPGRLGPRYFRNIFFLVKATLRDLLRGKK